MTFVLAVIAFIVGCIMVCAGYVIYTAIMRFIADHPRQAMGLKLSHKRLWSAPQYLLHYIHRGHRDRVVHQAFDQPYLRAYRKKHRLKLVKGSKQQNFAV